MTPTLSFSVDRAVDRAVEGTVAVDGLLVAVDRSAVGRGRLLVRHRNLRVAFTLCRFQSADRQAGSWKYGDDCGDHIVVDDDLLHFRRLLHLTDPLEVLGIVCGSLRRLRNVIDKLGGVSLPGQGASQRIPMSEPPDTGFCWLTNFISPSPAAR
jgi:hypothetical protein